MKHKAIFWLNNHDVNISDYISRFIKSNVILKQVSSQDELTDYLKYDNTISMVLTIVNVGNIQSLYQVKTVQEEYAYIPIIALFDDGSALSLANNTEKLMTVLMCNTDENNAVPYEKPKNITHKIEIKDSVKLTRRQLDVLKLITLGKSNKQIARDLALSEGTVKTHCMAIFKGIGVNNRTQAAMRTEVLVNNGSLVFNPDSDRLSLPTAY